MNVQKSFKPIAATLVTAVLATGGYFLFANSGSAGNAELNYGCFDVKFCESLASEFTRQSGTPVKIVPMPSNSSLHLSVIQESTFTRAPLDVFEIDVIWPGMLANDTLDLKPYFSSADLADFFPSMVENNTINGKLTSIPAFTDVGLLYYRKDLLTKYGFAAPPKTWEEFTKVAQTIQDGERASGDSDFYGYVFQGAQYESMGCNALEWLTSYGAGHVVEPDGRISINSPAAVAALQMARGWVGTISPKNVTGLREGTSHDIWLSGRAAFMRNWPYAYQLGNATDSKIKGAFDVAPLPKGPNGQHAGTLGGWQIAVNQYTRFPKQAAAFVKFLTSKTIQKRRAVELGNLPTLRSLYQDPDVLAVNPLFARMDQILPNVTARPSGITAARYDLVSTAFYTSVHSVLTGNAPAEKALESLERNINSIKGDGW
jgi:trehalose/maltose transport system substrate-binding protein